MTRRYPTILVGFLLCLLTGLGSGGAYGFVWCFGADGHSEVEFASGGDCDSEEGASERQIPVEFGTDASPQGDHCGPCVDLPPTFSADHSLRSESVSAASAQAALPAFYQASAFPAFHQILTLGHLPQPPPRLNTSLACLRTVVLLT